MTNIEETLKNNSESGYKEFIIKLTPGIPSSSFLGVRVPKIREIAKELEEKDIDNFLNSLPHKYYEENILHSILISKTKDFDLTIKRLNEFLPYVDNWAVCDLLRPKCFFKHPNEVIDYILKLIKSDKTYTVRFAVDMLMTFYLGENFKEEYLLLPCSIKSDEYYVKMMIAWFYATSLSKQWDKTITIIEERKLNKWVHNKSIQKAIESYRISEDQKQYLRALKIK